MNYMNVLGHYKINFLQEFVSLVSASEGQCVDLFLGGIRCV